MVLLPWSLVGLLIAYLVPNFPRTLNSSEECPGSWMRQVFDFLLGYLHTFFCTCQCSHPYWGESMMRRLLIYFDYCDQNGWNLPRQIFIRRFYYTFVNRFEDLHTLKHINSFLRCDRLTIKALYTGLSIPAVMHTVKEDLVQLGYSDLIIKIRPQKGRQILIQTNQTHHKASYSYHAWFFIPRRMARFFFDSKFTGKQYCAKLLIISSTFKVCVIYTSAGNKSSLRNDSPRNKVRRY